MKGWVPLLLALMIFSGICGYHAGRLNEINLSLKPEINLSFPKPVFLVQELPAPPPEIIVEEKEVYVYPRKFKDKAELLDFINWLRETVPFQPFGRYKCGLDTDLVQQIALHKGFIVNVEKDGSYEHLIHNAITEMGDYYTLYPPYYIIHDGQEYLESWHEYDPDYWKQLIDEEC